MTGEPHGFPGHFFGFAAFTRAVVRLGLAVAVRTRAVVRPARNATERVQDAERFFCQVRQVVYLAQQNYLNQRSVNSCILN